MFEPGGNRIELFGEPGILKLEPDYETRTWLIESRGWRYEVVSEPPSVRFNNVCFLADYRRAWLFDSELLAQLRSTTRDIVGGRIGDVVETVADRPAPIGCNADACGDRNFELTSISQWARARCWRNRCEGPRPDGCWYPIRLRWRGGRSCGAASHRGVCRRRADPGKMAREAVMYGVARDVTDRRVDNDELSALRRVATLAAEGLQPLDLFAIVAEEVAHVVNVPRVRASRATSSTARQRTAPASRSKVRISFGERWSLAESRRGHARCRSRQGS